MGTLLAVRKAAAQTSATHVDRGLTDPESCRGLFFAVIALAVRDAKTLESLEEKCDITEYERKAFRGLTEDVIPPHEFFQSEWFEAICVMVNVNPEMIRKRLYTIPSCASHMAGATMHSPDDDRRRGRARPH